DGFLLQRRGRARLHAGPAGHTFGIQERLAGAGGDLRVESAALDGQRERALDLAARPDAARADDAFGGVEVEIRIAGVLLGVQVVLAVVAVAHLAQPDDAGHVL